MAQNKIIIKRLLPKTILTGVLALALSIPAVYATVQDVKDSTYKTPQIAFGSIMLLLALAIIVSPVVKATEQNKKVAANVARKYLRQAIQEHPELKSFEKVLCTPRALDNVATFVFNSLTESEERAVLRAINELTQYYYPTRKKAVMAIQSTRDKVIKIISDHASTHPEFIQEVMIVMARADSTYVMPNIQHTR